MGLFNAPRAGRRVKDFFRRGAVHPVVPSDEANAERLVEQLRSRALAKGGGRNVLHVPTVATLLRIPDADALAAILHAEGRGWVTAVRARGPDVIGVALAPDGLAKEP